MTNLASAIGQAFILPNHERVCESARVSAPATSLPPLKKLDRRAAGLPHLTALGSDFQLVTPFQRLLGPGLPLLSLLMFGVSYGFGYYALLPVILLMHFIVAVRFTHDLLHGTAGVSPRTTEWGLFAMSLLLLESAHAFRAGHLHHHSHCLGEDDFEGAPAHVSLFAALAAGPLYIPQYWLHAYRLGKNPVQKRWMRVELLAAIGLVLCAIAVLPWSAGPLCYFVGVWLGSWFYPITTAWLPHFKPNNAVLGQARTVRGKIIPALLCNLSYHLEHHLYPQVPSYNLARLAEQLDPHFARMGVQVPRVV